MGYNSIFTLADTTFPIKERVVNIIENMSENVSNNTAPTNNNKGNIPHKKLTYADIVKGKYDKTNNTTEHSSSLILINPV